MGQPNRRGTMPEHAWRGKTTIMWPVEEGLLEFLAAPAAAPRGLDARSYYADRGRRGWTNERLIVAVCGTRGIDARDAALYDPISSLSERRVLTFRDAWRVIADPYNRWGHRDWRDVDITPLRECHPAWRSMMLPEWVEEMLLDLATEDHEGALARQLAASVNLIDSGHNDPPF